MKYNLKFIVILYCITIISTYKLLSLNTLSYPSHHKYHHDSIIRRASSGVFDNNDDVFGGSIGPLPSVSSKINYADDDISNMKYDL